MHVSAAQPLCDIFEVRGFSVDALIFRARPASPSSAYGLRHRCAIGFLRPIVLAGIGRTDSGSDIVRV
ncbi:MAG: hypothetical protein R6V12_01185, partial [Candidatus Hydrogenedentota bacterium]